MLQFYVDLCYIHVSYSLRWLMVYSCQLQLYVALCYSFTLIYVTVLRWFMVYSCQLQFYVGLCYSFTLIYVTVLRWFMLYSCQLQIYVGLCYIHVSYSFTLAYVIFMLVIVLRLFMLHSCQLQFYVGLCYIHVTRSGLMLCRCYMSTSTHLMCNYIPHAPTLPKTRTQWVSRPQVSQTSLSLILTMILLYNISTCTCLHVLLDYMYKPTNNSNYVLLWKPCEYR